MATDTDLQDLPIPELGDDPNIVADMTALANAIEKKLAATYASAADRDARVTSPVEGQMAILKDVNKVYLYIVDGATSSWVQWYPPVGIPTIRKGTTVPANSLGANDDVYFRY